MSHISLVLGNGKANGHVRGIVGRLNWACERDNYGLIHGYNGHRGRDGGWS